MKAADIAQRLRERADSVFHAEMAKPYTVEDANLDRAAAQMLEFLSERAGAISPGPSAKELKDMMSHG